MNFFFANWTVALLGGIGGPSPFPIEENNGSPTFADETFADKTIADETFADRHLRIRHLRMRHLRINGHGNQTVL